MKGSFLGLARAPDSRKKRRLPRIRQPVACAPRADERGPVGGMTTGAEERYVAADQAAKIRRRSGEADGRRRASGVPGWLPRIDAETHGRRAKERKTCDDEAQEDEPIHRDTPVCYS